MNAAEFREVMSFEQGLKEGDEIILRWTNCHSYFEARATVVRVNEKSIRGRLTEEVMHRGKVGYPAGWEISVPRLLDLRKWSCNNCAAPVTDKVRQC